MIDEEMLHVEETKASEKRHTLYQEDIAEILAWQGSESEALKKLNIDHEQFKYVRDNYDPDTLKLNYRRNLDVISYE